jgi:hypothetical protein
MKTVMSFNKLSSNRWYANIDDYPGDFEDLEMVMGADELLDRLSCGEDFVKVSIIADEIPSYPPNIKLTKYKEDETGAYYIQDFYDDIQSVYICNVTKFVLGYFPDTIYLTKIISLM